MEKKTIELEVKSNVEGSISELKALKRQLKDTAAGSEEFKKLYNQIDDLEDKIKASKNVSADWVDTLASAGGPVGALGTALNQAKVATQSFGGALKATGIGLVVSLVAGLAAAFNDNEQAQKKLQPLLIGLQKIMGGVYKIVEPLFNTFIDLATKALPYVSDAFKVVYSSVTAVFQSLGKLGSAVGKLISGDFSGAWKDAKESVSGFSKNFDSAKQRYEKGSHEMTKTEKENAEKRAEALEKENARKKAAQEKAAAEAEKRRQEELKKQEEEKKKREDHLKAVSDLENNFIKANQDISAKTDQEKLDLAKQRDQEEINRIAQTAEEKANLQALLNEKYFNLQLDLDAKEKKLKDDKDQADLVAKEAANLTKANDTTLETEVRLAAIAEREAAEKDIIFKSQEEKTAYEKANSDARIKIAEEEKKAKLDAAAATANTLSGLANLLGEETDAGKAAAVASATISTFLSAQKAYESTVGIPFVGPVLAPINAGLAIAGGIKSVQSILAVKTPNGGGGGSAPGVSAPPAAAAPQFNVVGTSGQNQIAQSLGNQQPVKAYVVANDVSTQQSLDRNIVNTATIGN